MAAVEDDDAVLHCAILTFTNENALLEELYRCRGDVEENHNRTVLILSSLKDEQLHLKKLIAQQHHHPFPKTPSTSSNYNALPGICCVPVAITRLISPLMSPLMLNEKCCDDSLFQPMPPTPVQMPSALSLRIVELESDCTSLRLELQSGTDSHAHLDAQLRKELCVARGAILTLERAAVQSESDLQGKMDAVIQDARVMNQHHVLRQAQHNASAAIKRSNAMYDCLSHEAEEDRARSSLELDGLARKVVLCNRELDSQVVVITRLTAELRTFQVLLKLTRPDRESDRVTT